jgi:hypothetical protein
MILSLPVKPKLPLRGVYTVDLGVHIVTVIVICDLKRKGNNSYRNRVAGLYEKHHNFRHNDNQQKGVICGTLDK